MTKFILVHDAENEASPLIINTDDIHVIYKSETLTGASHIEAYMDSFEVTETREQIFEMLNK